MNVLQELVLDHLSLMLSCFRVLSCWVADCQPFYTNIWWWSWWLFICAVKYYNSVHHTIL